MARLIDVDKADVDSIRCYYGDHCYLEDVQEWIDDQPTVDAVPVVHVTTTFHILSARHNPRHKPMTNGDRIRAMTDEELAAVMVKGDLHFCTIAETDCIYGWHTPNCIAHALKWLQQPVKEDAR